MRHSPAFAAARILLDPGEAVNAEAGAMAMMSFVPHGALTAMANEQPGCQVKTGKHC